jgi:glycosyltransferase involved in cell wall biosynthesis
MPSVHILVPGPLDTLTGGYGYDRRVIAGLRERGWSVTVHELGEGFPVPDAAARAHAARVLATIPDDAIVLVDGLALGALPEEVKPHTKRVRIIALVHHPLAAETGLDAGVATRLEESERRALQCVRHAIVTSSATAEMLEGYGVAADSVTVINPGTDPATLAHGSAGADVQLLCVASLIPRKGHEVLFRALASVPPRNWRLTCVGSLERAPETVRRLRAQVVADGVEDSVSLAGEMNGAALARCYDAADVFVLPTLYEGYGMVIAEALARGLPVVATRTGAIADLVEPDAGVVLPAGDVEALADALSRVIADPSYRARLAHGARRVRDRLPTWEQSCAKMAVTLAALLPAGGSHHTET